MRFENGRAQRVDDLVRGFQITDGRRWLRPVHVTFAPGSAFVITSDEALSGRRRVRRGN